MTVRTVGRLNTRDVPLPVEDLGQPVWGLLFGTAASPARMILFHAAGITPALLARWMAGQRKSEFWSEQNPVRLWARAAEQITDMAKAGVPLGLAGFYVLAGYTTAEAVALATTRSSTVASLRVEAELALPSTR